MYFDSRVPAGMSTLDQDVFFPSCDFTSGNGKQLAAAPTAAATQLITLTIDQDAHVLLVGAARVGTDGATDLVSQAFLPVLVTLTLTSSGRQLMSSAQHLENLAGTAQLPAAWARPKFLSAGSALKVQAQNLSGAALNVRLMFYAFKIFLAKT